MSFVIDRRSAQFYITRISYVFFFSPYLSMHSRTASFVQLAFVDEFVSSNYPRNDVNQIMFQITSANDAAARARARVYVRLFFSRAVDKKILLSI